MKAMGTILMLLGLVGHVYAQTNECGTAVGCACKTGKSANVIVPSSVTTNLQDGDIITARHGTLCVGQVTFTSGESANITVWGENGLTGDPGIPEGATIEYSVYRPATTEQIDEVVVTYSSGDGVYATGDLEFVQTLATSSSLPVELTQFEAVADGQDAVLVWHTASESNNAGFWVEHAAASDTTFAPLAFLEGKGDVARAQTYHHRVEALTSGTHRFRLKQVDFDGTYAYSPEVQVTISLPEDMVLSTAYPNPFNMETRLELEVARREQVEVVVYDALGRRVQVLYHGEMEPGRRQSLALSGNSLSSGLYFIRARGDSFEATRSVMLVK